jgi:Fe-S cluster biosynthesis and repair protein YggX
MPHPKGGYKINGQKVPGVTTIAGRFKDSGALLWWAFDQGKCAERGEISSLYDKRDKAADAGTLAHMMVENYINDKNVLPSLDQYPSEISNEIFEQAKQGFKNYKHWSENNKMIIVEQELELLSEKYMFGGCPDAIAYDSENRLCLLDWKTSNGVYPDYIIQLAAYRHLWDVNHPESPINGGFHLCRFSKENADFTHHYWSELDDAWEQFKLFRKAYDLDKKLKKRV